MRVVGRWFLGFILALSLLVSGGAFRSEPLRIMPLGDSITHGVCCNRPLDPSSGYRAPLAHTLNDRGFAFDFVGSLQDSAGDLQDRDHEGHDGWTTVRLREIIPARLEAYQPDIILLLAGTNDLGHAEDPQATLADAVASLGALIDAVTDHAPQATVLVAPIPPLIFKEDHWPQTISEFNRLIEVEVALRASTGQRVVWVPMAWNESLVSDRVHPNTAGYQMMADAWASAILDARSSDGSRR